MANKSQRPRVTKKDTSNLVVRTPPGLASLDTAYSPLNGSWSGLICIILFREELELPTRQIHPKFPLLHTNFAYYSIESPYPFPSPRRFNSDHLLAEFTNCVSHHFWFCVFFFLSVSSCMCGKAAGHHMMCSLFDFLQFISGHFQSQ